jgi:hypothetical protein
VERRYQGVNSAAAGGTTENESLLVVDPELGAVPEKTVQVVNHNVHEIEGLKKDHEALKSEHETLKARMNAMETHEARLQAIEQGKS